MKDKFDRDRIQQCLEMGLIKTENEGPIIYKRGRKKTRPCGFNYYYNKPKEDKDINKGRPKIYITEEDKVLQRLEYNRRSRERNRLSKLECDDSEIEDEKSLLLTIELKQAIDRFIEKCNYYD